MTHATAPVGSSTGRKENADRLAALVAPTLARLRDLTGASLTFAGRTDGSGIRLAYFDGQLMGPLRGALVDGGFGLGSRVLARRLGLAVPDYARTPLFTHNPGYDEIIRAEALRAMAAAPVIVGRRKVGVLYAAGRGRQVEMGRAIEAVADEARALEQALAVSDVLRCLRTESEESDDGVWRARVQDAYAQLRLLAGEISDAMLRSRLLDAADALVAEAPEDYAPIQLTPREQDVLTLLGSGLSNMLIAERLGIGLYTVKGYVKSLMVKLDAATRFEAVVNARRVRLIP